MVKKITTAAADDHNTLRDGEGDPVAAGLASLADETAALLTPPAPEGEGDEPAAPAVPAMTNAQCIMMGAQLVRGMLESVAKLKSPADTMADEKLQPAADALGAVFDKHGWNLQGLAGDYQVELVALVTAGPVAWAAYAGIQAEIKARPKTAPAESVTAVTAPKLDAEAGALDKAPVFAPDDPRSISLDKG